MIGNGARCYTLKTPNKNKVVRFVAPSVASPAAKRLTAKEAQARVHKAAKNTDNIVLATHARDRMEQRSIYADDVYRILRQGYVDDPPIANAHGNWTCKVTLRIRGQRTAGVITIILIDGRLFVKTVEWEDA